MEQTMRRAIALDADFASFYPAVPNPGTQPFEVARHLKDIARMPLTNQGLVWKVVTRMVIGKRERPEARPPAGRPATPQLERDTGRAILRRR
jgi:hypothetical protein